MTALNIFLAIVGVGVTALVIAGMVLLEPRHLVSDAVETDLSDVKPHRPGASTRGRSPATAPVAERGSSTR